MEVDGNPHGLKAGDPVVVIPYVGCGQCIACRQGKTNCCTRLNLFGVHWDGGMQECLKSSRRPSDQDRETEF